MNSKLRKIALGMSGLMCAGMLFTSVLPAKAAPCKHIGYEPLGEFKDIQAGNYDEEGHYITIGERGCCATCGEYFDIWSKTAKEGHEFYETYDPQGRLVMKYCRCEYVILYIYPDGNN